VADSRQESNHAVITDDRDVLREPFPEEVEDRGKGTKAKNFFREHPRAKWAVLIFLVVGITAGILLWKHYSIRETTDDAQLDAHIYPVSSRVSGTVIEVKFDENDRVKKGQVLVVLDPRDYQVALQRAEAELSDAQATARAASTGVPITSTTTTSGVATARANLNAAQKAVDAARARAREAEAMHNKAAQDLKRFEQLVQKEEISRQQYDAAVAAEQGARATLDAARSQTASAESQVVQAQASLESAMTGPQQIQVQQAKAGSANAVVQTRQAAVAQARLNLGYTTIVSPVNGITGKRNVQVGQVIQPGQPTTSVVDLDDMWVTANFKETQLKNMRPNQPAKIHVDAYDGDLNGHVMSIGGATGARFSLLPPENATGNYVKVVQRVPVRIALDPGQDQERRLRPGMSVVVTVITK
jgi:membrane fusion protein (multidrug efflux system)